MKRSIILLFLVTGILFKTSAQVEATKGKITLLRVHDVGTKYGPPSDQIDAEVIVKISSKPDNAFGFKLRKDDNQMTHAAMMDVLKQAFVENREVRIEYTKVAGKKNYILFRVILQAPGGTME